MTQPKLNLSKRILFGMPRWSLAIVVLTVACSSSPTTPTPLPTPGTATYTLSGTVTGTSSGQALAGATIDVGGRTAQTDAGGRYTVTLPMGSSALPFTVSGTGIAVPHGGFVRAGTTRTVDVDAISSGSFDLGFYRQLARGQMDGELAPIARWTMDPRLYIQTVDAAGRAIEPEVLAFLTDWAQRAVPLWTANQFHMAAIETGTASRSVTAGTVVLEFIRDPTGTFCGRSSPIGRNPGRIIFNDDLCSCGSIKIPANVILHEFGHVLGYHHVNDPQSLMYPIDPGSCRPPALSPNEQRHAAIVYHRPPGNTDPDNDAADATTTLSTRAVQN